MFLLRKLFLDFYGSALCVQVWEASAQKQVVKVERYNPHAHVVDMQEWIQDKRQDPQLFPGTSLLPLRVGPIRSSTPWNLILTQLPFNLVL